MEFVKGFSKTKIIVLFLVLAALIAASAFFIVKIRDAQSGVPVSGEIDYIIPGVPYYGVFSHKNLGSYVTGDTPSALASVLEYWNPGKNNFVELQRFFTMKKGHLITADKLNDFINTDDYTVQKKRLEINDLKKYINSETKTPLFMFFPIDENQPDVVTYHPATLLIGIKDSEKKLVFHNYWLGNNYEISYDTYEKMWERMRTDERKEFIVIQPKDLSGKLREIDSRKIEQYPARTSIMEKTEQMFKNYAIGRGAFNLTLSDISLNYFNNIMNDPNFNAYFPPYFKVILYTSLADLELGKTDGNMDVALGYATKSVGLNHDLDKAVGEWPGYEARFNKPGIIDRISDPYKTLGDVYLKKEDYVRANENYSQALDIQVTNEDASFQKKIVEVELQKSK